MIKIINGNLFDTDAEIICHQCNCQGVMGSGVAAEVKCRYPNVYMEYRKAYESDELNLGHVIFSLTGNEKKQVIANLLGQLNYGRNKQHTSYTALQQCLKYVRNYVETWYQGQPIKIAFPYGMGSVRGGGDWNTVYRIIEEELGQYYNVEIWRLDKG